MRGLVCEFFLCFSKISAEANCATLSLFLCSCDVAFILLIYRLGRAWALWTAQVDQVTLYENDLRASSSPSS